jgi:hypothetical protein
LGALGLLLAVPLLAVLIVLVREIYSYDLLGLRGAVVEVETGRSGTLTLDDPTVDIPAEEVARADTELTKPLPRMK